MLWKLLKQVMCIPTLIPTEEFSLFLSQLRALQSQREGKLNLHSPNCKITFVAQGIDETQKDICDQDISLEELKKNITNRKKAEARKTGGGPPPPSLTPAEELALSLNKGRPVVDGIPGSVLLNMHDYHVADGHIVLLDPPATPHSVTVADDEETTSAVTETENVGRPIENMAGDLNTDEGPSTSTQNLSSLPAKELYKVHLQKQIRKSDMEMDLIQLQMEEKRLNLKKRPDLNCWSTSLRWETVYEH
ncbi:unnamed protein product [Leuciscus chuanchicus]